MKKKEKQMRNLNEKEKQGITTGIAMFFKMKNRKQQKQNKIIKITNIRFL